MPNVRELPYMSPVVFNHEGKKKHGHLVCAGPKFTLVHVSNAQGCLQVRTADVSEDEGKLERGDHPSEYGKSLHTE